MRGSPFVLLALLLAAGCVAPDPEAPAEAAVIVAPSGALPAAPLPGALEPVAAAAPIRLDLAVERAAPGEDGGAPLVATATATNVGARTLQVWWPACETPVRVGIAHADGIWWPEQPGCAAAADPAAYDRDPTRMLAPGETLTRTLAIDGWIHVDGAWEALAAGEQVAVARVSWYGAPELEARAAFLWTEEDAIAR